MIFRTMNYAERYREELACFRADLPILTGEKIEQRCRTLSLLLTAAVRSAESTTTQIYDKTPAHHLRERLARRADLMAYRRMSSRVP